MIFNLCVSSLLPNVAAQLEKLKEISMPLYIGTGGLESFALASYEATRNGSPF